MKILASAQRYFGIVTAIAVAVLGTSTISYAKDAPSEESWLQQGMEDLQVAWKKATALGAQQAFAADKAVVEQALGSVYLAFSDLAFAKDDLTRAIATEGPSFNYEKILSQVKQLNFTVECLSKSLKELSPRADVHFDGPEITNKLLKGLNQKTATLKDLADQLGINQPAGATDYLRVLDAVKDDSEKAKKQAEALRDDTARLAKSLDPTWLPSRANTLCKSP